MRPALVWTDGAHSFGVYRRDTLAIMRAPTLSPVPAAPAWLRGVANRFGRAVPVVDPRRLAGLPGAPAVPPAFIVVVPVEGGEIALAAATPPVEQALGLHNRVDGAFELHGTQDLRVVDLSRLVAQLSRELP